MKARPITKRTEGIKATLTIEMRIYIYKTVGNEVFYTIPNDRDNSRKILGYYKDNLLQDISSGLLKRI